MDDISDDEDDLGDCDNGDNRDDECGRTGCFLPSGFPGFQYRTFSDTSRCPIIQYQNVLKSFCKRHLEYFELPL